MTVRITGPRRRAPWRGAIVALAVAAAVVLICLILLGLTADFLVDWLWFSTIGYSSVFWTTIVWSIVDPALPLVFRTPLWVVTSRAKLPMTRAVSSDSAVLSGPTAWTLIG